VDMNISTDIHGKSVDTDMDTDGKFRIDGKPANATLSEVCCALLRTCLPTQKCGI